MIDHNISHLSCTSMKEDFSLKNTTHYCGANLLLDYALWKLKLPDMFTDKLTIAKNPNAIYPLADTLTT